jgi:hypothetical protein
MALVTIVPRDVADRFHGFLASVMLEVSPCVFVAPRMTKEWANVLGALSPGGMGMSLAVASS